MDGHFFLFLFAFYHVPGGHEILSIVRTIEEYCEFSIIYFAFPNVIFVALLSFVLGF